MYIWKYKNLSFRDRDEPSEVIGVTPQYLSMICGRKVKIRKTLAYCIVKFLNEEAEIEDFFERVED